MAPPFQGLEPPVIPVRPTEGSDGVSSERPYPKYARRFCNQYKSIDFDQMHRDWLPLLSEQPNLLLAGECQAGIDT